MAEPSLVLSALEFDVLWEAIGLPPRHVAVDVPSPGATHAERSDLVAHAWDGLAARGLVRRGRPDGDLTARLRALAGYRVALDAWVWEDRPISALAVRGPANGPANGAADGAAHLAVLDAGEVWLIPATAAGLAASAVSVAGEVEAGRGRSVRVPLAVLRAAEESGEGDPDRMIAPLQRSGLSYPDAQVLTSMFTGRYRRGQFGGQRRDGDGRTRRTRRVAGFHDTPAGRFLTLTGRSSDGSEWLTVAPADNARLARCVAELVDRP